VDRVGGDLVDLVAARAEALDQAAQALDGGGADRIALEVFHSQPGMIQPPGIGTRTQGSARSGRDDWGPGASLGSV
jgi:hypothetical protein